MNDMSEEKEGGLFTCPVMSWRKKKNLL